MVLPSITFGCTWDEATAAPNATAIKHPGTNILRKKDTANTAFLSSAEDLVTGARSTLLNSEKACTQSHEKNPS